MARSPQPATRSPQPAARRIVNLVCVWWGGGEIKILLFCGDKSLFFFLLFVCVCGGGGGGGPFSRFFLGLTSKTDYLGLPESSVYFCTQGINEYIK